MHHSAERAEQPIFSAQNECLRTRCSRVTCSRVTRQPFSASMPPIASSICMHAPVLTCRPAAVCVCVCVCVCACACVCVLDGGSCGRQDGTPMFGDYEAQRYLPALSLSLSLLFLLSLSTALLSLSTALSLNGSQVDSSLSLSLSVAGLKGIESSSSNTLATH